MDNTYKGVLFSESVTTAARIICEVEAVLDDKLMGGSQLRNLDDVKDILVKKVKAAGGNALVGFTYGQRQASFWKSIFSLDDVIWWGKGKAAKI